MHWWDGSWHWSMMMAMTVFWIVIVFAVVWAVRALFGVQPRRTDESPEDILRRRFAAGEISKEEFEANLRELRK